MSKAPKEIKTLDDVQPDIRNHNLHTPHGMSLMESSVRECGYGDSMTVDKHGNTISGNGRLETLQDIGMLDPIVVQSDGTRPIIHQRIDLDIEDPKAKRLAYYQNWVGHENFNLDTAVLQEDLGAYDLSDIFSQQDLDKFFEQVSEMVGNDQETDGDEKVSSNVQCPQCGHIFDPRSKGDSH